MSNKWAEEQQQIEARRQAPFHCHACHKDTPRFKDMTKLADLQDHCIHCGKILWEAIAAPSTSDTRLNQESCAGYNEYWRREHKPPMTAAEIAAAKARYK